MLLRFNTGVPIEKDFCPESSHRYALRTEYRVVNKEILFFLESDSNFSVNSIGSQYSTTLPCPSSTDGLGLSVGI